MIKIVLPFLLFLLCSCGDDITNVYKAELLEKDTTQVVIDTSINSKLDTVYVSSADTIVHIDTIINIISDTNYIIKYDTLYIVNKDTVLIRQDEELPRDTSVTLSVIVDSSVITKTYYGVVYKNVFYESQTYPLGYTTYFDHNTFHIVNTTYDGASKISYKVDITSNASSGKDNVYITHQCGIIAKPDYKDIAWTAEPITKRIGNNWRVFNELDANKMYKWLNKITNNDTTLLYVSTIEMQQVSFQQSETFSANATKQGVNNLAVGYTNRFKLKYACVYDL